MDTVCFWLRCFTAAGLVSFLHAFNLATQLPIIKEGPDGSYFGYSVALHQKRDGDSLLLVGAPKAWTPESNYSGAVYSCPLSTYAGDCEKLVIDQNINHGSQRVIKDDQWLGVTVRSQGPGGYVMACAHRFVIAGDDYQWGQGICYSLREDLEYGRAWQPCNNRAVNKAHEQYGYCQAGTSGDIAEDNTIIIGTPGPFTWRGTVFTNTVSFRIKEDKRWYYGPHLEETSPVDKYSYLGMSITSGIFFANKRSFVAGAPRSNGTGQVVFFTKKDDTVFDVQLILNGEQFASSFGYSLTSLDVNSDRHLDLVVGAPFYYSKGKGGAIYVYMNSEQGFSENTIPVKLTGKVESRFGFAIENAGDLNQDGYADLAVGAPYEEDGGAVYIYSGSSDGLILTPSQVIYAKDIPKSSHLKTFGYSFDGGIDIDKNGYPDLIVGSYESNTAVLLRSRPVLDIMTSVSGNLSNIDPDKLGCEMDRSASTVCFTFKACFQFNSTSSSAGVKLQYKIEAETFTGRKFYRVRFKSSLDSETPNIVLKDIEIKGSSLTRKHCSEEVVYLKDKSDIQNPVQFKLTYSLIQKDPVQPLPGSDLPNINLYPILNQQEASKVFEAKFLKDCGEDDICESALEVIADINLHKDDQGLPILFLGEKQVSLSVKVLSTEDPAYDAMLYVYHPQSLSFVGRKIITGDQIECVPFNSSVVACELGNPLKRREVELQIRFNPKDIAADERSLRIFIKANTTSVTKDDKNNEATIEAGIVKVAELEIRGASQPEQAFYGGEVSRVPVYVDEVGNEIVHIYEVINYGPWLATDVEMVISWPFEAVDSSDSGKWLLYIVENPEVVGNGFCNLDPSRLNPLKLKRHVEELRLASGSSYLRRNKRSVTPQELRMDGKIVKVVSLDCDAGTANCFQFTCTIRSLDRDNTAIIKVKARLWNSTFVKDYPNVDWVSIRSRAFIRTVTGDIRQDEKNDFTSAETKAYPDIHLYQKPEEVALWIIILAACAGILLLIVLIIILWKCGFFKRKKPGYQPAPTHDREYE